LCYNIIKVKENKNRVNKLGENKDMKKLNRANYTVIDEFGCDITTIVNVFENEQNGKLFVIDEFDLDITKRVKVLKK
jgi:hypothetical protein